MVYLSTDKMICFSGGQSSSGSFLEVQSLYPQDDLRNQSQDTVLISQGYLKIEANGSDLSPNAV